MCLYQALGALRSLPVCTSDTHSVRWIPAYYSRTRYYEGAVKETDPDGAAVDDYQTIASILSSIENVDVSNLNPRRLGKVDPQTGPRPILVNMRSSQDALRVVRNKRLLPKGVEVSLDKTAAQRKHLKALIAEVDAHNESHRIRPRL